MHVMTKATLGVGGVLFLISTAALVMGGASFGDWAEERGPEMYGDEYWTGDTSSTFSGELDVLSLYYVFVEEGYEVDVDVSGSGYFESCEYWDDCEFFDVIPGYDYIGDIAVDTSGDYEVDFSETQGRIVDVKITEEDIPVGGLLGLGGGCCGICGALLLLIIGGIMAFTLKDKPKVQTRIQIDNEMVVIQENPDESLYDQDEAA